MKIFAFLMLIGALAVGTARAQFIYNGGPCSGHGRCFHNPSKECVDAREAFKEHHNGKTPEQWCNQYYQGQRGRWVQQNGQWGWSGAEGDQYYQGRQGHWYRDHDEWRFRGDKGDQYAKGPDGHWGWGGAPVQPKAGQAPPPGSVG
ncbi:MAG TPA: hypothetical protein VMT64_17095, partial [Candidatus Binataceae bacterium]|nr:hypothetical protein [Candidatus Binataceae bacterium]